MRFDDAVDTSLLLLGKVVCRVSVKLVGEAELVVEAKVALNTAARVQPRVFASRVLTLFAELTLS